MSSVPKFSLQDICFFAFYLAVLIWYCIQFAVYGWELFLFCVFFVTRAFTIVKADSLLVAVMAVVTTDLALLLLCHIDFASFFSSIWILVLMLLPFCSLFYDYLHSVTRNRLDLWFRIMVDEMIFCPFLLLLASIVATISIAN